MLVLTRKIGEQIQINKGQITIKFLYHRDGMVAFGISAPADIDVDRQEIFSIKQRYRYVNSKKINSSRS